MKPRGNRGCGSCQEIKGQEEGDEETRSCRWPDPANPWFEERVGRHQSELFEPRTSWRAKLQFRSLPGLMASQASVPTWPFFSACGKNEGPWQSHCPSSHRCAFGMRQMPPFFDWLCLLPGAEWPHLQPSVDGVGPAGLNEPRPNQTLCHVEVSGVCLGNPWKLPATKDGGDWSRSCR